MSRIIIASAVVVTSTLAGIAVARWKKRRADTSKMDGFPPIDEFLHQYSGEKYRRLDEKHLRITIPDDENQTIIEPPVAIDSE
jgi:hypothetical protein